MSIKIHSEVETLLWQKHELTIPRLGGGSSSSYSDNPEVEIARSTAFKNGDAVDLMVDSRGIWILYRDKLERRNATTGAVEQTLSRTDLGMGNEANLYGITRGKNGNYGILAYNETAWWFFPYGSSTSWRLVDRDQELFQPQAFIDGQPFPYPTGFGMVYNHLRSWTLFMSWSEWRGQNEIMAISSSRIRTPLSSGSETVNLNPNNFQITGLTVDPNDLVWVTEGASLKAYSDGVMPDHDIRIGSSTRIRSATGLAFYEDAMYFMAENPSDQGVLVRKPLRSAPTTGAYTLDLWPRYLRMGVMRDGNFNYIWTTNSTVVTDPASIPHSLFSIIPNAEDREGEMVEVFTAHLYTFNNFDNEIRPGYSNGLLTPPVINESIPSLTSSMTSFGGISIAIGDPDIRRLFDGTETQTTSQNPVRVYRRICGKRTLVWSGFLDGVSISSSYQTSLNCRPLLKKFDQLASFGFEEKSKNWETNNFVYPIIACKLMPWAAQHADHSPVGTETHSFLCNPGPRGQTIDLTNWGTDSVEKFEIINRRVIQGQKQYSDALLIALREPHARPTSTRTILNQERTIQKPQEEANKLAIEHFNIAKTPRYVSFNKSDLTRSIVSIDEDTGKMTFERGIMFAESASADAAARRIRPAHWNYEHSLIPEGAQLRETTFTSAPHYERFLLGMAELDLFDSPYDDIKTSYVKSGLNIMGPYIPFTTDYRDIIFTRKGGTSFGPFDYFSVFPSLKLGENYCNWTHIPVRLPSNVTSLYRDYIGAQDYPPAGGEALTRPVVRYVRSKYTDFALIPTGGFWIYDQVPSNEPAHPLDSFFRSTQFGTAGDEVDGRFSGSNTGYIRWVLYTPHGVSLSYFGRKNIPIPEGAQRDGREALVPEYYFFTQFTTFVTYTGTEGVNDYVAQELELKNHHASLYKSSSDSVSENYNRVGQSSLVRSLIDRKIHYPRLDSQSRQRDQRSFLQNGINEIAMPRSKDMYSTEESFEADQDIQVLGNLPVNLVSQPQIWGTSLKIDSTWKSQASASLRVMPAHPPPREFRNYENEAIYKNNFPVIKAEGYRDSGAYYVSSSYDELSEVGYWDTSRNLNAKAHVNASKNFFGYYHHHQAEGQGISPRNFLYSIVKAVGIEPDWDLVSRSTDEMSKKNPMQLISDSGKTYKSLIDRVCPGLGKMLRWNPLTTKMEIINWLTAHRDADQDPVTIYDEDCLFFGGITSSSVSIPSSFTFENPDLLRGANTLEGFSEQQRLLSRYVRITSSVFIQGKAVDIKTATWHEDPTEGLKIYDKIAEILSYRVSVVSFTISTEVLLGLGPIGTLSVGKWVRLLTPAFTQGIGDVLITETASSELQTSFRAYHFLGVGIQDPADNDIDPGAPPESESDIPGDDSPPDDEGVTDGANLIHRIYY